MVKCAEKEDAEKICNKEYPLNFDSARTNMITSHDDVQLVPLSKGYLLRQRMSGWMS